MAKTTVYTCDVCKQNKSKSDLTQIEVTTDSTRIESFSKYNPLKIDICKECLKEKGFLVEYKNIHGHEQNKEILRNKMIDILREIGVAFIE